MWSMCYLFLGVAPGDQWWEKNKLTSLFSLYILIIRSFYVTKFNVFTAEPPKGEENSREYFRVVIQSLL